MKLIKGQLIFFHPAITQNFNFAAAHALGGKWLGVRARCFFRKKHRQTAMISAFGVGARQKCHHMGARRMGDPCFIAGDLVIIALFCGPGAQCAQIRSGVGFGKDCGWQNFGAGNFGQPMGFLIVGAAT